MQLVEQKKISLDDKLSNWLPDLPHAGEVSLGNLISMTSGYREFVPDPEFLKVNDTQPYKTWAPEEILPYGHLDLPLLYPPGTNWNYAHTNFVIVGMALVGAGFRFLVQKLSRPASAPAEYVLGLSLVFQLFYAESNLALMWGGLLLTFVSLYLTLRLAGLRLAE